jgi:outer membrane protein assembly factor BamB
MWKSKFKFLLIAIVVLTLGLLAAGCVRGLAPIGWSGGAVSGGKLYIGSREGRLVVVNLADESPLFTEAIKAASSPGLFGCSPATGGCGSSSSGVPIYGNPVVSDNLVYIAGYNGKIYAYTADTLAARWVYPRESYLEPFVGGLVEAGGRLFIGDSDGHVYALDAATGDKIWDFNTGDKVWADPTVEGDTLYIGSFDDSLYALNTADGTEKWHYATGGAIMAKPLVDNGTVYIGSFDRNLYALDAASGNLKWQFPAANWFWAEPVVVNGRVYAACLDGKIYVLNAGTGSEITQFDVKNGVSSNPVMVNGKIIFAERKGGVYAVDPATNQISLLVNLDQEIDGPLTAYGGVVYIHLQDMTLQRFDINSGQSLRPISLEYPKK